LDSGPASEVDIPPRLLLGPRRVNGQAVEIKNKGANEKFSSHCQNLSKIARFPQAMELLFW
jgi:hypothetical protein